MTVTERVEVATVLLDPQVNQRVDGGWPVVEGDEVAVPKRATSPRQRSEGRTARGSRKRNALRGCRYHSAPAT